jgi:hypothetical protein
MRHRWYLADIDGKIPLVYSAIAHIDLRSLTL